MKITLDTYTRTLTARGRLNPRRSKQFADIGAARAYLDHWMRIHAPNVRSAAWMDEAMQGGSFYFRTPAAHHASVHVFLNPYV